MAKSKKKIMIIDDEQSMLFLEKAILTAAGYEVISESDSKKAFTTAKEQIPDLILMDIVMPEINGIELAEKIKKDKIFSKTKIFAVTGMPMLNDKNMKNFEKIIVKPFHMDDLLRDIKKVL
jgi:CheY-like chemotaxis protein